MYSQDIASDMFSHWEDPTWKILGLKNVQSFLFVVTTLVEFINTIFLT